MTMPIAPGTRTELPPPQFPMLTRMISNSLFPSENGREEPVVWIVSQPHPLAQNARVVRMFIDRDVGVEVYSELADGKGIRNLIPLAQVRLTEEAMPREVLIDEIAAVEEDEYEPDPEPEPPTANGQVAP